MIVEPLVKSPSAVASLYGIFTLFSSATAPLYVTVPTRDLPSGIITSLNVTLLALVSTSSDIFCTLMYAGIVAVYVDSSEYSTVELPEGVS